MPIKVDPKAPAAFQPELGEAPNGIPLINISTPTGSGLSHNKYLDFNVDPQGAILNNTFTEFAPTKLGGIVQTNPNLLESGAARVILNEVTSAKTSNLLGILEVGGSAADVVIANPNGILCDGCGFINTPRVSLTTGQAQVGPAGRLTGFTVESGQIRFGPLGAQLGYTDLFDVISKKIQIDGPIKGKKLRFTAGSNKFDYATGLITPVLSGGDGIGFAIDSTALGGMYADTISLVATDKGAGVRAPQEMAANAGSMHISADGKLVLGRASATGSLTAKSASANVSIQKSLFSQADITLEGHTLIELAADSFVASTAHSSIRAHSIELGDGASLRAGVDVSGRLADAGGDLSLELSDVAQIAKGSLAAAGQILIKAKHIDLAQEKTPKTDQLSSKQGITLNIDSIDSSNSKVKTLGNLAIIATDGLALNGGEFKTGAKLLLEGSSINSKAKLQAIGSATLNASSGDIILKETLRGDGGVKLQAAKSISNQGEIVSLDQVEIKSATNVTNDGLVNTNRLEISAVNVTNNGSLLAHNGAATLALDGILENSASGKLVGADSNIKAKSVFNAGKISAAKGTLHLNLLDALNNSGLMVAQKALKTQAQTITNSDRLLSSGSVELFADNQISNGAKILAKGGLKLKGRSSDFSANIDLQGGSTTQAGSASLKAAQLTSDGVLSTTAGDLLLSTTDSAVFAGRVISNANTKYTASGTVAIHGEFAALASLEITGNGTSAAEIINSKSGSIKARDMELHANALSSDGLIGTSGGDLVTKVEQNFASTGRLLSTGDLLVHVDGDFVNSGEILSKESFVLAGYLGARPLSYSALASAVVKARNIEISAKEIENAGVLEAYAGNLALASQTKLTNKAQIASAGNIKLAAGGSLTNDAGTIKAGQSIWLGGVGGTRGSTLVNLNNGLVNAATELDIKMTSINNAGRLGARDGDLLIDATKDVSNTGLFYGGKDALLKIDGILTNDAGDILAENNILLSGSSGAQTTEVLNKNGGNVEAITGDLVVRANSVVNETNTPGIVVETEINNLDSIVETLGKRHTKTTYTKITVETETLPNKANFSRMLAGKDIVISAGSVANNMGMIAANNDLSIDAASFSNSARDLVKTTTTDKTHKFYKKSCSNRILGMCSSWRKDHWDTSEKDIETETVGNVFGTIEAGGTVSISATDFVKNESIREGAEQIGLSSGTRRPDANDAPAPEDYNIDTGVPTDETAAALSDASSEATTGTHLPVAGIDAGISAVINRPHLVVTVVEPDAPFLIETRPEFVDLANFVGSDYFLSQFGGFDPDKVQKRLGDAFVETRVLREQIFALTGKKLIENVPDERAQMRALYDNAIDAQKQLNLTVGVALTPKQIAALKTNIIWMEPLVVQGQEVLVPKIYLAMGPKPASSARIAGKQVLVQTAKVQNSGDLFASDTLTILASDQIDNSGGRLLADDQLNVESAGNIINSSGVISGTRVTLEATDLINETQVTRDFGRDGYSDRLQTTALIDAGEQLDITLSGDLQNTGATLSSGADMNLIVDGDATFTA
ncbi:filamentous hemagglutinin N-terminal domain-containing protein, partial [Polycladidibacter hongkongensis]|uniref:two-partner secretion domain-containing protein n=1 Tax=Polycladidibacter hongkongensis TaxID=1647556 RepID=UPI00155F2427